MNTKDMRQGRSYTAMELVARLREIAQIGIVNANRDTTILRQAADMMQSLAEYKINHLPPPTDRDYSLLLEECTNRGARIRELEKKLARARHEGPEIGKAATGYCYDEKTASGLIEED